MILNVDGASCRSDRLPLQLLRRKFSGVALGRRDHGRLQMQKFDKHFESLRMPDRTFEYTIDGNDFSTLEEFFDTISTVLIPNAAWGRNLDAFNDILRGGFGTPEDGFRINWLNSEISKQKLGYGETVRQLELRLKKCHPANRSGIEATLENARKGVGTTVFDWLIEIIRDHGVGGGESDSNVKLSLE